jgi:hypothetical protein
MSRKSRYLLSVIAPLTLGACGIVTKPGATFPSDASARPFVDTPTRFNVDNMNSNGICQSPIVDPSTKASLKLVRSQPGRGDYEVRVGQYGARANEYLRVDCTTYMPIGLVLKRGT